MYSSYFQWLNQQVNSLLLHRSEFSIIALFFATLLIIKWFFFTTPAWGKNLPPSPRKLPIIGNLHQLGLYPHQSLRSLAQKHGQIMLLYFGGKKAVVLSSPAAACEVLKTHDLIFSNRPYSNVNKKLLYEFKELAVAPYGEYWRQLRSICVLQLLSNSRVHSVRGVREEETALLVKRITDESSSSSAVNMSELLMTLTNDVVCRAAFGRKYSGGESGRKFRKLMSEFVGLLGGFDVGTYIPWLAWVNRFSGFDAKVDRVAKEMDEFLERVVQEHEDRPNGEKKDSANVQNDHGREDFADVLLGIYKDKNRLDFSIDRDSIKALLLDIFAGGTDTTYTVLEWAMSELLRHPRIMKELQNEVRGIARANPNITDEDLEKMHYLKAVIKETLRIHPPIPLLIPRESSQYVKVMGYEIGAGTMVITNVWAMGRDPALWDEPEEFRPERFLNSSIDFKGQDFELIPFGAGRRGCPGMTFAMATNEIVLANLVQKFDWELPDGMKGEDLDMTECTGLTIHRKIPLLAVATPCSI